MSRLVFTVWIPLKPVVSKTSQAEVWLSSYDYLTKCLGQGSASQQLSQRKGAFFLLNKKKALSGLVQVNDRWWREERLTSRKKETMVASYRYLGVSNPGLQMIGSNECDVPCLYDARASFQYIRRIPTLNYSQA